MEIITTILNWLSTVSTEILDRVYYTYILVTHSELAAGYLLATILIIYFTVALTIFLDEARSAYKKMPK